MIKHATTLIPREMKETVQTLTDPEVVKEAAESRKNATMDQFERGRSHKCFRMRFGFEGNCGQMNLEKNIVVIFVWRS